MARVWQFGWPTQVHFGRGALRGLGEVVRPLGTSVLLLGYRDRAVLEATYDRAVQSLSKSGLIVSTYFRVAGEPGEELVLEGARRAVEDHVEVIVALGGGSVIDAAKGIAAVAQVDGALWDYAQTNPQARPIARALPVVAVPTTAGTGSEVSPVAVFHLTGVGPQPEENLRDPDTTKPGFHDQGNSGVATPGLIPTLKATLSSPTLAPRAAVVDPDLTLGSPPELVATAGLDALGHALEAYGSRRSNPLSALLARQAIGLIDRHLRAAVAQADDPQPREPLALAALLAGAAFSAAGVGVGHVLAHGLGGVLHVPHGRAVAIATAASLPFNADACQSQYAELADACGLGGSSPAEQAARFVEEIQALIRAVGVPQRVPVPADAPEDLVERLVQNASQSVPLGLTLNPRKVDPAALAQLFEAVLERDPGK